MSKYPVIAVVRHNTNLGGDLKLAIRELEVLAGSPAMLLASRKQLADALGGHHIATLPELRQGADGVALAWDDLTIEAINRLLRRSAFLQEVIVPHGSSAAQERFEEECTAPFARANDLSARMTVALPWGYIIESEGVLDEPILQGRVRTTVNLLLEPYVVSHPSPQSRRVRKAKKTTLSLSHDLHIYKAKFFPRMVHALINIFGKDGHQIVDPYCGSGTALLEASLLGYDSVGVDVDPICQMISRTKVTPFLKASDTLRALDAFEAALQEPVGRVEGFEFPVELEKKILRRDRIDGTQFHVEITEEARCIANAIRKVQAGIDSELLCVLASDAVTKKIRYRFIGVGNGKYTIEIVKQPLLERVREKVRRARELCYVFEELRSSFGLKIGTIEVHDGDARKHSSWNLTAPTNLLITSPPYLPASSGREHYTASRALSFAVLGIEHGKRGYYNMNGNGVHSDFDVAEFPEADRLMSYLMSDASENADPQRDAMRFERKAMPTRQYLADMLSFFRSVKSTLKPNGHLLLVVANQHTFYSHRRQELEFIVSCRELYSQIAASVGLSLKEEIKMELLKSAVSKARPRASDDYVESILVSTPRSTTVQRSSKTTAKAKDDACEATAA